MPGPAAIPVRRKPWLAALLSFLVPGLGQLYAGRPARALLFALLPSLAIFASCVSVLLVAAGPLLVVALLALPAIMLAAIIDAVRAARAANAESRSERDPSWSIYLGPVLGCALAGPCVVFVLLNTFVVRMYTIPTGAMAPTILGAHMGAECPNCEFKFAVSRSNPFDDLANGKRKAVQASCKSCGLAQTFVVDRDDFRNRTTTTLYCRTPNCRASIDVQSPDFDTGPWVQRCTPTCPNCGWEWELVVPEGDLLAGDKILVNKLGYLREVPRRWDVVVFRPPHDHQKLYVMRLVGLPGETLEIREGDLVVNGRIARKPPEFQEAMWMPVYSMDQPEKESKQAAWVSKSGAWTIGRDAIEVSRTREPVRLLYSRPIRDWYGYNPQPGFGGHNVVGDLRLSFEVEVLDGEGWLGAGITRDLRPCAFRIPVVAVAAVTPGTRSHTPEESTRIEVLGELKAHDPALYWTAGQTHRLDLSFVDGAALLAVDGRLVLEFDEGIAQDETAAVQVSLESSGVNARWRHVEIERDVFYIPRARSPKVTLGPDQAYVLGDNSPNSRDSRIWGAFPAADIAGKAVLRFRLGFTPGSFDWSKL